MWNFTKTLFCALALRVNIDDLFQRKLEVALNELLKTELTACLDYEKYNPIGYNSGKILSIL